MKKSGKLLFILCMSLAWFCPFRSAEAVEIVSARELAYIRLHVINETEEPLFLKQISASIPTRGIFSILRDNYEGNWNVFVQPGEKACVESFGDVGGGYPGAMLFELGNTLRRFQLVMNTAQSGASYVHRWQLNNVNFEQWQDNGIIRDTEELYAVSSAERTLYGANRLLLLLARGQTSADNAGIADVTLVIMPKTAKLTEPMRF